MQAQVIQALKEAVAAINGLSPNVFKHPKLKQALPNKISAAVQDVDQGLYQQALDKLQNDILAKTDGCAKTGAADKNDWLTDCATRGAIYPQRIEAMDLLKRLIYGRMHVGAEERWPPCWPLTR